MHEAAAGAGIVDDFAISCTVQLSGTDLILLPGTG